MKKRTLCIVLSASLALAVTVAVIVPVSFYFAGKKSLEFLFDKSYSNLISVHYDDGNFGNFSHQKVEFEYYRAMGKQENAFVKLMPLSHPYGETLGGSLYNLSPLNNVASIEIAYFTEPSSGLDQPTLYFGQNGYDESFDLVESEDARTLTLRNLENINYFKIESGDSTLVIESLQITLREENIEDSFAKISMGKGKCRSHPTVFSGNLEDGVSSVKAPLEVTLSSDGYTIEESKTYTYYSLDYARSYPEKKEEAAMLSPMDVANYFAAFNEFPANYAYNKDGAYEEAYEIFGDSTRVVSTYTRVNGYAQAVPYANLEGSELPLYHELDIALLEEYSNHLRGVGRLVCFESGLDVESYGKDVVSYFTDDHYATFQEFDNLGGLLPRFSVKNRINNLAWGKPSLVVQKA